tara:strand:+ start:132 stop:344 length:213 start_codon:yes stop_codon:yes gene_type:complete
MEKKMTFKLSNQAVGALLMTLQKCLSEESDITELLKDWELENKEGELIVLNPPSVKKDTTNETLFDTNID